MKNHRDFARQPGRRRAAFTLIELLVVIAIISILIALTAAVALGVLSYQRNSTTQSAIQTLGNALETQWRTVAQQAANESIPPATLARLFLMAGSTTNSSNVEKRARLIWVKLRLKQEFPMNFSEALFPLITPYSTVTAVNGQPAYLSGSLLYFPSDNYVPAPQAKQSDLVGKQTYWTMLRSSGVYVPATPMGETPIQYIGKPPNGTALGSPAFAAAGPGNDPYARQWPLESSILLPLALQEGRSGNTFKQDTLPASALRAVVALNGQALNGQFTQVVDAWSNPLVFYRWPAPNPTAYDPSDPANANNRDVDKTDPDPLRPQRDLLDPDGLLIDPTWNNQVNWTKQQGVWWFEQLCHSVHEISTQNGQYVPTPYYMQPVTVSAGKDGVLGLAQPLRVQPLKGLATLSPFLPDTMTIDANPVAAKDTTDYHNSSADNIYSYLLRPNAQGN
jgi:prepilin-type N-terminal cleavage/methylation domain-containing protein